MKTLRIVVLLALITVLLFGATSCAIYVKDNGEHKGWYKNPKKPHYVNYMDQGKSNGKHKNSK
jgi:hypothetical protein